jgi:hypothetical protein
MRLTNLQQDHNAIENGDWEEPGEPWTDPKDPKKNLRLKVRGYGDAYNDRVAKAQEILVREARRDGRIKGKQGYTDLPLSERNAIGDEIHLDFILIDVENAEGANGQPLTVAQYRELARQPGFRTLIEAIYVAAGAVTERRAKERADAEGNSTASSSSASTADLRPEISAT